MAHSNNPEDRLDEIVSDFAEYRKEKIRIRNNTNRARSKRQERAVATFLGGQRVPMSGAGMLKGDGIWNSPLGLLVFECKYSAASNPARGKTLRFDYGWLSKMEQDTRSMSARFGFLVIHFYNQIGGTPWGTAFINQDVTKLLLEPEWLETALEYTEGKRVGGGMNIYYQEIRNNYKLNKLFPCQYMETPHGRYTILPLWALRQRIYDVAIPKEIENDLIPGTASA